jgi:uncharacterized paraquat-inducible protein A
MKCRYCQAENDPHDEYCHVCDKHLHLISSADSAKTYTCKKCGTVRSVGFCPTCGRWNGPKPGGFLLLSVVSFVNAAILLLTGFLALAQAQNTTDPALYHAQAVALPALAAATVFNAINFLRIRRWILKAVRIVLIGSFGVVAAGLVASLFQSLNPVNFMNLMITVLLNVMILFSLKNKDYLFTRGDTKPSPKVLRRCEHCGYENLTSFDRRCPRCAKELT